MKVVLFSVLMLIAVVQAAPKHARLSCTSIESRKRDIPKQEKHSERLYAGDPLLKQRKQYTFRELVSQRRRRHPFHDALRYRKPNFHRSMVKYPILKFRSPEKLQEYLFSEAANAKHILRSGTTVHDGNNPLAQLARDVKLRHITNKTLREQRFNRLRMRGSGRQKHRHFHDEGGENLMDGSDSDRKYFPRGRPIFLHPYDVPYLYPLPWCDPRAPYYVPEKFPFETRTTPKPNRVAVLGDDLIKLKQIVNELDALSEDNQNGGTATGKSDTEKREKDPSEIIAEMKEKIDKVLPVLNKMSKDLNASISSTSSSSSSSKKAESTEGESKKSKEGKEDSKDEHKDERKEEQKSGHKDEQKEEHKEEHKDEHKDEHKNGHRDEHKDEQKDEHKDEHKNGHRDEHKDEQKDERKEEHREEHKDEHKNGHRDDHKDEQMDEHKDEHKNEHKEEKKSRHKDEHKDKHKDKHKDDHQDEEKEENTNEDKDEEKDEPHLKHNFPCRIDGVWVCTVDALHLNISILPNLTLKVSVLSQNPKKSGHITKDWTINGVTLATTGGPFLLAAVCPEKKKVANFIGQCRSCREEDIISGLWTFSTAAKDCTGVLTSFETKIDVFRRDKSHQRKAEKSSE